VHEKGNIESLIDFPCDYLFKAFGPADPAEDFENRVCREIGKTVPVPLDAVKTRRSSGGTYIAVSVVVRLYNFDQVTRIYKNLRRLDGIKYLL